MNLVVMQGRLATDPELRYTPQAKAVANFRIAVDDGTDREGNPKAAFFPVVVWEKLADAVAQHLTKGSPVLIQGRLQTRSWEQNGERKYMTEIVAHQVKFLGSKPKAQETQGPADFETGRDDSDVPF